MSRALHVRLDGDSEAALGTLRAEGLNDSQAVRLALVEAHDRRRQRTALRQEAARLAEDPANRREMAAVAADFEGLTAAWPEDRETKDPARPAHDPAAPPEDRETKDPARQAHDPAPPPSD